MSRGALAQLSPFLIQVLSCGVFPAWTAPSVFSSVPPWRLPPSAHPSPSLALHLRSHAGSTSPLLPCFSDSSPLACLKSKSGSRKYWLVPGFLSRPTWTLRQYGILSRRAVSAFLPPNHLLQTHTQINQIINQEAMLSQKPRKGSHHVLEIENALRVSTGNRVQRTCCMETLPTVGGKGSNAHYGRLELSCSPESESQQVSPVGISLARLGEPQGNTGRKSPYEKMSPQPVLQVGSSWLSAHMTKK